MDNKDGRAAHAASGIEKPETTAVHYLKYGKTACPFSREHGAPPAAWPRGHVWSQRWQDVTCPECLAAKPQGESPATSEG